MFFKKFYQILFLCLKRFFKYIFSINEIRNYFIFAGDMRVDNTGQLKLNMISQNSWEEPFGLNNVHLDNCSLSAAFEPGLPLPNFGIYLFFCPTFFTQFAQFVFITQTPIT